MNPSQKCAYVAFEISDLLPPPGLLSRVCSWKPVLTRIIGVAIKTGYFAHHLVGAKLFNLTRLVGFDFNYYGRAPYILAQTTSLW